MKEPSNGCRCYFRGPIILFLCTLFYIYIYSYLTIKTKAVNDKNEIWQSSLINIKGWLQEFAEITEYQETGLTKTKYSASTNKLDEQMERLKEDIFKYKNNSLITLFTTWQTKKDKFLVHNITINNWKALSPFVRPVLFTNEEELCRRVQDMGWSVLPISKSAIGIPILKYMYLDAMSKFKSTFYAYSNGDILYTESLLQTLVSVLNFDIDLNKPLLIVGKRTNVQDVTADDALTFDNIRNVSTRGQIFRDFAEDYFITNANYPWKDCAEVVVGRRAYDNWLVLNARIHRYITIDATKTLLAVHQTTKAGNYEGHAVPNSNYNDDLLVKMYRNVPYMAGLTSCTSFYTDTSVTGETKLLKRKIQRKCVLF